MTVPAEDAVMTNGRPYVGRAAATPARAVLAVCTNQYPLLDWLKVCPGTKQGRSEELRRPCPQHHLLAAFGPCGRDYRDSQRALREPSGGFRIPRNRDAAEQASGDGLQHE